MKIFAIKNLLIFTALILVGSNLNALIFDNSDCRPNQNNYECACNPLYCGSKSVQFNVGVAPILWRHRGQVDVISCAASVTDPIVQLSAHLPKFRKLFEVPWTVGAKFGYAWTDNVELYVEFNYVQAEHRGRSLGFIFPIPNLPSQSLTVVLGKYKLYDGYVGVRYYWDRWCEHISPFFGGQIGFVSHRNVHSALSVNGVPIASAIASPDVCVPGSIKGNNDFFLNSTEFAGGLNAGVDICFCGNWSVVITAEFLATCGPRTSTVSVFNTPTPAPLMATNLIIGGIKSEFRFPVTIGLKRTF